MRATLLKRTVLTTIALAVLLLQLVRAPLPTVAAAALFAGAWWFPRHRHVEHRRHAGRHTRRRIATTALIAAGLWTGFALLRTVRDILAGFGEPPSAEEADPNAPWPGAFLVDGLLSVAAISGILTGRIARGHRHRRGAEGTHWAIAAAAHEAQREPERTA